MVIAISGVKLMWMIVMFDLPVGTDKERKKATKFRNFLLDEGFSMSQFSVYLKFCGTKEQTAPVVKRIVDNSPKDGQISILFFIDKQFSDIINIQNREIIENKNIPEQLLLL